MADFTVSNAAHAARLPVTLITGAEQNCGIMDYATVLRRHLAAQGVDARIAVLEDTSLARFAQVRRAVVRDGRPAPIIHLQYPLARSNGLALYLLACDPSIRFLVTFHEFSAVRLIRRLSFAAFALTARQMIFTTDAERASFLRYCPWSGGRSQVVPIGSNIPMRAHQPEPGPPVVVTFSLIRPRKGLEQFIELARCAQAAGLGYRFRVIGARCPWHRSYADQLLELGRDCDIDWQFDLATQAVSEQLSRAHAAYMPFPDGATERRGSLLAVLGTGLPTVTTRGPATPEGLAPAVAFAEAPEVALSRLRELMGSRVRAAQLGDAARRYAERFGWDRIARDHAVVYRRIAEADAVSGASRPTANVSERAVRQLS